MAAALDVGRSRIVALGLPRLGPLHPSGGGIRDRMHVLDACLEQLEAANLKSADRVPAAVAIAFGPFVSGLTSGMQVSEAIGLVFREQDVLMRRHHSEPQVPQPLQQAARNDRPLSQDQARSLTEQIRAALGDACIPLLAAHQGKAWRALGYKTWAGYVQAEFGLSRSRSYELLVQARVMHALRQASGMSEFPDISAHAAAEVLPRLGDLERSLARQISGQKVDQKERAKAVSRAVRELREAEQVKELGHGSQKAAVVSLIRALRTISTMPDPVVMVDELEAGSMPVDLRLVEQAESWLNELALALRSQPRLVRSAAN
jgi:hypothetical protein